MFITRVATYSGWTSKPTPRSETARLSSNAFKVFDNDEVFLSACIVMMFKTMAVEDKKALKTQVMIRVECKPCQVLAIFSTVDPEQCSVDLVLYNLTGIWRCYLCSNEIDYERFFTGETK